MTPEALIAVLQEVRPGFEPALVLPAPARGFRELFGVDPKLVWVIFEQGRVTIQPARLSRSIDFEFSTDDTLVLLSWFKGFFK